MFESRSQGEGLKLAIASQGNDAGRGEGAPAFDDVTEAVESARERFAGRLLFQLNSGSALEGNSFKWPDRFWRALEWLATSYYDSRTGLAAITDLDESCRSASGMWYKSSQHDVTMASYRNWYTTKVGGRNIWLQEHIGKGTGFDPRRTIRIAFDWDRALQQVSHRIYRPPPTHIRLLKKSLHNPAGVASSMNAADPTDRPAPAASPFPFVIRLNLPDSVRGPVRSECYSVAGYWEFAVRGGR